MFPGRHVYPSDLAGYGNSKTAAHAAHAHRADDLRMGCVCIQEF
jgi:hypothetical protein